MIKQLRAFRLIPILLVAVGALFALKSLGLVLNGGFTLGQRLGSGDKLVVTTLPASSSVALRSPSIPLDPGSGGQVPSGKQPWMQEMFNYRDVTGSVSTPKPAAKEAPKEAPKENTKEQAKNGAAEGIKPPPAADGKGSTPDRVRPPSVAERALLERLQERNQELEARKRELDIREGMLKEAEKKLQAQVGPKKQNDAKAGDPSDQTPEPTAAGGIKALVTMYQTMKPKDAARIFDRLDAKVLLDIARSMNPRQMSEILAQMTPEMAERLTVEMAATGDQAEKPVNPATLPKILGKANGGRN